MEEGRQRERKVWGKERIKTSGTLEWEAGGFPQTGLRLDQMWRTMDLGSWGLGSRKGKARGATQSLTRTFLHSRSWRSWAPLGCCLLGKD